MTAAAGAPERLAIVDVHYRGDAARAACIVASNWTADDAEEAYVSDIRNVRPYVAGRFFERELPCIVDVLAKVESPFDIIVIDGYVHLDEGGTPGLGAHLHARYDGRHPVVGIAKTAFGGHPCAAPVMRGRSQRPLFVTAQGIPVAEAVRRVSNMHGAHRIPTLLGKVDCLARAMEDTA